jgi:hypothetical protein
MKNLKTIIEKDWKKNSNEFNKLQGIQSVIRFMDIIQSNGYDLEQIEKKILENRKKCKISIGKDKSSQIYIKAKIKYLNKYLVIIDRLIEEKMIEKENYEKI